MFYPQKIGLQNIFCAKKILVPKNYGSCTLLMTSNSISYKPKPSHTKQNCPKHLGLSNFCEEGQYAKFGNSIAISCCNFKLSGGWVGGTRYIIMPLRGPNLQVRTCKIQAKLDSKLGPSVAISGKHEPKPNQTKLSKTPWIVKFL